MGGEEGREEVQGRPVMLQAEENGTGGRLRSASTTTLPVSGSKRRAAFVALSKDARSRENNHTTHAP